MDKFVIDGQYSQLLQANGLDPRAVLKEAGLPVDTFARQHPQLDERQYFAMLDAVAKLGKDPLLPAKLVQGNRLETFAPPILAAYCSQDGLGFINRLAHYKKLIGPITYQLAKSATTLKITLTSLSGRQQLSPFFVKGEWTFLIEMLSRATKKTIAPVAMTTSFEVTEPALISLWGVKPSQAKVNTISFHLADLQLPFATRNVSLLGYLEPELANRLAELDVDDSYEKRVRSCLVELLPRGKATADDVAANLGVSKRTLQRRLRTEGTNFQQQLNATREMLAKNYLLNTDDTVDEIAYLLAYQETNSFLRAFSIWTRQSVQQFRKKNAE